MSQHKILPAGSRIRIAFDDLAGGHNIKYGTTTDMVFAKSNLGKPDSWFVEYRKDAEADETGWGWIEDFETHKIAFVFGDAGTSTLTWLRTHTSNIGELNEYTRTDEIELFPGEPNANIILYTCNEGVRLPNDYVERGTA